MYDNSLENRKKKCQTILPGQSEKFNESKFEIETNFNFDKYETEFNWFQENYNKLCALLFETKRWLCENA